jgi:hypothetical protein
MAAYFVVVVQQRVYMSQYEQMKRQAYCDHNRHMDSILGTK